MMTYGWAILIIVIVAGVLYSLGIFNPSSSISTTITGFSGLGSVTAQCMPNAGLLLQFGNSIGQEINVTSINVTSPIEVRVNPNALVPTQQSSEFFVPSSTLCVPNSKYSISVSVTYLNVGSVFPGPYFSAGTIASQAGGNGAYVPITVTNSQTIPTPSPFQQMVNVSSATYTQYESPTLQNVFFSYQNGTVIPSWLESGNSNTAPFSIYWIKLVSGIAASSSAKLFMVFAPLSTNIFASGMSGEAPQLSPTYGEYDTGPNVFNFYDNFAGTTLDTSRWTNSGITYTVNNGFTATSTAASGYIYSGTQISPGSVIEFYGDLGGQTTSTTAETGGMEIPATNGGNFYGVAIGSGYPTSGEYLAQMNGAGTLSTTALLGAFSNAVLTIHVISSTTSTFTYNYGSQATVSADAPAYPVNLMLIGAPAGVASYTFSPSPFIQWFRTRAYPPSGVMPSVNFGAVQ